MHHRPSILRPRHVWHRAVALFLVGTVLGLAVLAVAPGLHEKLHGPHQEHVHAHHGHGAHDHGHAHHDAQDADHRCAITLFAAGVDTAVPSLPDLAPDFDRIETVIVAPDFSPRLAPRRLQPPGRAPPGAS